MALSEVTPRWPVVDPHHQIAFPIAGSTAVRTQSPRRSEDSTCCPVEQEHPPAATATRCPDRSVEPSTKSLHRPSGSSSSPVCGTCSRYPSPIGPRGALREAPGRGGLRHRSGVPHQGRHQGGLGRGRCHVGPERPGGQDAGASGCTAEPMRSYW